ncbi:polysaccharide deacetylase family protein [Patescibacteria group bacterium]|nr:polysaccharide deacetylase family protein [Patescibacteria group bacterium]
MIFTTSWDDGRKDDMRLAELLDKYSVKGTFYVSPPSTHEKHALTNEEIKSISDRHEIGAHTMTHPKLTRLEPQEAQREIEESKRWIESITKKPCHSFCYPYGDENPQIRSLVANAGFSGARTVEQLLFSANDPFGSPTTLQVYPFPLRKKFTRWWHPIDICARLRIFAPRMIELRLSPSSCLSWLSLAKALFTYAQKTDQPFFHLWGHSWEIEKYGMWDNLEKFLKFVSENENVEHSTNHELLR